MSVSAINSNLVPDSSNITNSKEITSSSENSPRFLPNFDTLFSQISNDTEFDKKPLDRTRNHSTLFTSSASSSPRARMLFEIPDSPKDKTGFVESESPLSFVPVLSNHTTPSPNTMPKEYVTGIDPAETLLALIKSKHGSYKEKLEQMVATTISSSSSSKKAFVVGRALNSQETELYEQAQKATFYALAESTPGIIKQLLKPRFLRGTYFIDYAEPAQSEEILKIFHELNSHGVLIEPIITILRDYLKIASTESDCVSAAIQQIIRTCAVFKPSSKVRHANGKSSSSNISGSKDGIESSAETANENITMSLSMEPTIGMEAQLMMNLDTEPKLERGYLMEYLPEAVSFRVYESVDSNKILSLDQLQSMALNDLRFCNSDRHAGNLLISELNQQVKPIDHALVLSAGFKSPSIYFWMELENSKLPFKEKFKHFIKNLNSETDIKIIREAYPHYPAESLETLRISYYLLQQCVLHDLSPYEIGLFLVNEPFSAMGELYHYTYEKLSDCPLKTFSVITHSIDEIINMYIKDISTIDSKERFVNAFSIVLMNLREAHDKEVS